MYIFIVWIPKIKIHLEEDDLSEDIKRNYISKRNIKEIDSSDQIRNFIEPNNKDDLNLDSKSQHKCIDEAEDHDKLPLKKEVIAETVRLIPINLPDGRFVEISASADGGPRSQVCARETLRSAPHRH